MSDFSPQKKYVSRKPFRSFCVFNAWEKSSESEDNSFVGIKIEDGEPKIYFPMGYQPDESEGFPDEKEIDDELKRDFAYLLALLADKSLPSYFEDEYSEKCKLDFPIHAFLGVLQYYQSYGYFFETNTMYKKSLSGKICWSRTIKKSRPQVPKDEKGHHSIVYLDLIAKRNYYIENNLITEIHKFCVHESVILIGPLLGITEEDVEPSSYGHEPHNSPDFDLFLEVIQEKIESTFKDRLIDLFNNMLQVIKFLANKQVNNDNESKELFGVNGFAHAWEMMVDKIFGTLSPSEKEECNPRLWYGQNNLGEERRSTLRPDTIMIRSPQKQPSACFILDSKYYKFGMVDESKCKFFLPGAESVCKQIAYAEYAEAQSKKKNTVFAEMQPNSIYNAFIMPYCAQKKSTEVGKKRLRCSFLGMKSKGFVYGDWKNKWDDKHPYFRIACILLDVKSVMRDYNTSDRAQNILAKQIISAINLKKGA